MTPPDERRSAVSWARRFLEEIAESKQTPKISSDLRKRAKEILKHYPTEHELNQIAKAAPDMLGVWRVIARAKK